MKPTSINSGVVAILCAISIAAPAITVTPPVKSTPNPTTPLPKQVAPPTRIAPSSTVTPSTLPATNPRPSTAPTSLPLVAVPALTPAIVKNFTNLYGQALGVKFAPDRQQKISQRLTKEWMTNLGLRNTVFQTIALEPQILRGTLAERSQLQAKLVANLRQQVLDGDADALWLVSFYDASPKNWLAPGKPPLTRMTSDMSAEVLCFMVNEVMGKAIATPDSRLKNAIATKLTAEYAKIPGNTKQELSRLPTNWLAFKDSQWLRRGNDFREQMRVHWGQNLEAYIPDLREMSKLRRDRLAKIKADPQIQWDRMNSIQRQAVLLKSDLEFQNSVRSLAPVKNVQLANYINTMTVANAIGNSPTSYLLPVKVK